MLKIFKNLLNRLNIVIPVTLAAVIFGLACLLSFTLKDEQRLVPVLMYHSIGNAPIGLKYLTITERDFENQLKYLSDNGYTTVTFDVDTTKIDKPIYITFDDGYIDNYKIAYPLLKKYKMTATIFLAAKFIDKPRYMTREQIISMQDIISFQSHTYNHVRLSRLSSKKVEFECAESKKIISEITKKPVTMLSYPDGDFTARVSRIASKYYSAAVTTLYGFESQPQSNYKIRRVAIDPKITMTDFMTILQSNGKL